MSTETVHPEQILRANGLPTVEVLLHVSGRGSVNDLAAALADLPDVAAVIADDVNAADSA